MASEEEIDNDLPNGEDLLNLVSQDPLGIIDNNPEIVLGQEEVILVEAGTADSVHESQWEESAMIPTRTTTITDAAVSEEQEEDLSEDSDVEEEEEQAPQQDATTVSENPTIGQLLQNIQWNFHDDTTVQDKTGPRIYSGPSGLKQRVAEAFTTPFECLNVCGGLDHDLICRLARNSNEYARTYLLNNDRNKRLLGHTFNTISVEEMYHFLGITLRISLSPIDYGGYQAYFSPHHRRVLDLEIEDTKGFAQRYMSLIRYKQIRSAFHPENRSCREAGDKCYQLRHAINNLNQAAKNVMHIGENVTFDEGGIGSRHRLNPVRQYNKDKPQKFRVDFFIMACSRTYFIHHLDVYQGANSANTGISR